MPLSKLQKEILLLIRKHRNPNSFIAGGVAIHRNPSSLRESSDIDIFHDADAAVTQNANSDISFLEEHGYVIHRHINQPSYIRATVSKNDSALKLEWVRDTAFRFFPIIEDNELGYRLSDADLCINKCLALANRNVVRDIIDLLQLTQSTLSLASSLWAACGKDPGFTPSLILECMKRNSIIRPEELEAEHLSQPLNPTELKKEWLSCLESTEEALKNYPVDSIGALFLASDGSLIRKPDQNDLRNAQRHYGSLGGCWPQVVIAK